MQQVQPISVTFHGVRGSTPCAGADTSRYGGNTSCVSVDIAGHDPILFDMGTGMRYFEARHATSAGFRGHVLLSHLHWDHTQGLPFFSPILCPGSRLDIYGPSQEDGRSVADVLMQTIRPPLFPISLEDFAGQLVFHDVGNTELRVQGDVHVLARLIPHVGPTCGYRLSAQGSSITYMSDHQMPRDGSMGASDAAFELAAGADLLIHDAQYTSREFAWKSTWGHCTFDYAVWFAAEAGAKKLVLFHHDPTRCDDAMDRVLNAARTIGDRKGVEVVAAAEGLTIEV